MATCKTLLSGLLVANVVIVLPFDIHGNHVCAHGNSIQGIPAAIAVSASAARQ